MLILPCSAFSNKFGLISDRRVQTDVHVFSLHNIKHLCRSSFWLLAWGTILYQFLILPSSSTENRSWTTSSEEFQCPNYARLVCMIWRSSIDSLLTTAVGSLHVDCWSGRKDFPYTWVQLFCKGQQQLKDAKHRKQAITCRLYDHTMCSETTATASLLHCFKQCFNAWVSKVVPLLYKPGYLLHCLHF